MLCQHILTCTNSECVLCEAWTDGEETVEHRSLNAT